MEGHPAGQQGHSQGRIERGRGSGGEVDYDVLAVLELEGRAAFLIIGCALGNPISRSIRATSAAATARAPATETA